MHKLLSNIQIVTILKITIRFCGFVFQPHVFFVIIPHGFRSNFTPFGPDISQFVKIGTGGDNVGDI